MNIEVGGYRVAPYKGLHCWQVQKRNKKGEWEGLECYTATVEHALELTVERILKESKGVSGTLEEQIGAAVDAIKNAKEQLKLSGRKVDDAVRKGIL